MEGGRKRQKEGAKGVEERRITHIIEVEYSETDIPEDYSCTNCLTHSPHTHTHITHTHTHTIHTLTIHSHNNVENVKHYM